MDTEGCARRDGRSLTARLRVLAVLLAALGVCASWVASALAVPAELAGHGYSQPTEPARVLAGTVDLWSGSWSPVFPPSKDSPGTITFQQLSGAAADNERAKIRLDDFQLDFCAGESTKPIYTGSYDYNGGGTVLACAISDDWLWGIYRSGGGAGTFRLRISGTDPRTFRGTFSPPSTDPGFYNSETSNWTGTFVEPRCLAPRTPSRTAAPCPLAFVYSMPDRVGLDTNKDGLVDSFLKRATVAPKKWKVEFEVPGCDRVAAHNWTVDGASVNAKRKACVFTLKFGKEGQYRVHVESGGVVVGEDVVVQDWLIVGLGDSVASGEGNPDKPIPSHRKTKAAKRWQDRRCHRSANSYQARTAKAIEDDDTKTSVTFIHLACSGAGILAGITGPYRGIVARTPPLAAQLKTLKKLTGGREIDAVMINVGANDLRFGQVLGHCVIHPRCYRAPFLSRVDSSGRTGTGSALPLNKWLVDAGKRLLPRNWTKLAKQLEPLVPADRVIITQYPDELRNAKGKLCRRLIEVPVGPTTLRITSDEVKWLSKSFLGPLNKQIKRAAKFFGWTALVQNPKFARHGYCAGKKAWVVTLDNSERNQGNMDGTMHPNGKGHEALAALTTPAPKHFLHPGDKPRLPGSP